VLSHHATRNVSTKDLKDDYMTTANGALIQKPHKCVAIVDTLFIALAASVLCLVIINSVTRPDFPWDSRIYHLPFSALIWNIGDARSAFVLADDLAARLAGFPVLPEFLQGAAWKLSGTIVATTLINSLSLVAFIIAAYRAWKLSLPLLVFGIMSVPLIVLHSSSSLIDLFTAAMICFQVLAASMLDTWRVYALSRLLQRRFVFWSCVYVLSAAAIGNSKLLGLPVSLSISTFALFCSVVPRRKATRAFKKAILLITSIATVLSFTTVIRNVYEFGNPFYPFGLSLPSVGLHFLGTEEPYSNYPVNTSSLGLLAHPINWLLSVTEIEWAIDQAHWPNGAHPTYDLGLAEASAPFRTGGYWGVLVIGSLFIIGGLLATIRIRDRTALQPYSFPLWLIFFLTIVTSFLPQSHELRYYLYWPILLIVFLSILLKAARPPTYMRLFLATLYLVFFLYSERFLVEYSLRVFPIVTQQSIVSNFGNSPEVSLARRIKRLCLGPQYNPDQFMYSSVFHGGNYVIVQGWEGCD
jgi:hypothetical protein